MGDVQKRPQVIHDLIEIATYIATHDINNGGQFLYAAEATFKQLGKMPNLGKFYQFSHVRLQNIRQIAVRGFRKYLIFYQVTIAGVEIIRVLHGSRDIMRILEADFEEES